MVLNSSTLWEGKFLLRITKAHTLGQRDNNIKMIMRETRMKREKKKVGKILLKTVSSHHVSLYAARKIIMEKSARHAISLRWLKLYQKEKKNEFLNSPKNEGITGFSSSFSFSIWWKRKIKSLKKNLFKFCFSLVVVEGVVGQWVKCFRKEYTEWCVLERSEKVNWTGRRQCSPSDCLALSQRTSNLSTVH